MEKGSSKLRKICPKERVLNLELEYLKKIGKN